MRQLREGSGLAVGCMVACGMWAVLVGAGMVLTALMGGW